MSKSKTALLGILLLTSLASTTSLNVGAQSAEIVIDSQVEWIEDRSLEGDLRIVSGGDWTLNGLKLSISDGVTILVEEGGILNVQSSEIEDTNPPTGLAGYGYWDEVNRSAILIPGSDYDGPFDATFHSGETGSFYGGQAIIEGRDAIDLNGSEFTLSFDADTDDVWVGLVGYGHQSVHLATVTMIPDLGSSITYNAIDLQYQNMMALDNDGTTCDIEIAGSADFDDSSILGCKIVVDGMMTIHSTSIDRTGPIISNENSDLVLSGQTAFSMSKADHDVRAHANSRLHWGEEVLGSGGHTDRWERVIGSQELHFDAAGVLFRILNFGQYEITSSTYFSDENGVGIIDSGNSRTVEIGWADGSEPWTESASIEIIEYRTGWNMDASMDDYGGGIIPLTWDEVTVIDGNTPFIEYVSVDFQNPTESISRGSGGVGLLATIANRGTAPATVYFTCDVSESGVAAQMTSYPGGLIEAGEEIAIQFSWMNSDTDLASLTCEILTPTQLVEEDAFGGGIASTGQITWFDPPDEEGSIIPIVVAIFIAIATMAAFFFRMTKSSEDEEEELY